MNNCYVGLRVGGMGRAGRGQAWLGWEPGAGRGGQLEAGRGQAWGAGRGQAWGAGGRPGVGRRGGNFVMEGGAGAGGGAGVARRGQAWAGVARRG